MRITQEDIARIANVSQSTVSRVVAGDLKVEDRLRDRVVAVMEQYNYQPDVRARSLRQKRQYMIGLVVKRPIGGLEDDPFFTNLIAHITDYLAETPYHLCVDVTFNVGSQADVYDEMLRTRRVDGLILVESEARDDRILRLQRDKFPFVLIGNPISQSAEILSVDNDNVFAGRLATKHLIDQGYNRIGFLSGPKGVTVCEDRIAGYTAALSAAGMRPHVWHTEFGFESARKTAEQILRQEDRPDALVVLDDFMAMGVVVAARTSGLRMPGDIGIVGFNDSYLCRLTEVELTSVSLNIQKLVQTAVEKLLAAIEDGDVAVYGDRRTIIDCDLKVRGSSARRGGSLI